MKNVKKVLLALIILIFCDCMSGAAQIYVTVRPPRPVVVRPVAPSPRHIWIDEDWEERGGNYVWVGGRWETPREGYAYRPGYWSHTRHGDHWYPGKWYAGREHREHDHDRGRGHGHDHDR